MTAEVALRQIRGAYGLVAPQGPGIAYKVWEGLEGYILARFQTVASDALSKSRCLLLLLPFLGARMIGSLLASTCLVAEIGFV